MRHHLPRPTTLVLGLLLVASGAPAVRAQEPQPVTLPDTEVWVRHSGDGREFRVYVALPPSYRLSQQRYPVLYTTDPNLAFASVTQIARTMWLGQALPELVIVGVGYATDDVADIMALRTRDYTPTAHAAYDSSLAGQLGRDPAGIGSGGAPAFLRYMTDDLMPWVADTYRVQQDGHAIGGFSLGGLFALYVLLTAPDTFDGYLIGSPSLWWHDGAAFALEREYARGAGDLAARVFLSVGALEGVDPPFGRVLLFEQFVDALEGRDYPGLELETVVFPDESHYTAPPATTSRGLRWVFGGGR